MAAQWTIRGKEYANCNCNYGCPCQFNSPTTYGNCEGIIAGHIEEGNFGDTRLDGLDWTMCFWWPGEIAAGNGRQQIIIDESADDEQRAALKKILHGEDTAPGATHFFVYNSMASEVLETLHLPIDLTIDVEARTAELKIDGIVESKGSPIINPHSGEPHHARINLPNGFEYTVAEMGSGSSKLTGGIQLELTDSYGQFNILHMNQDGVIR
jgi:hypothetical protein